MQVNGNLQPRTRPRRNLVVGLGRTGLSVARYLSRRGESVAVVDSREAPPMLAALREELPDVAVFLGPFDGELFRRADRIVLSPGVDPAEPAVAGARAAGVPVLGDVELFAREVRAPVVAITGSNGKSTVTALVGEMARRAHVDVAVGGNIGTPVLELLERPKPQLYVLELSSFQLESTESLAPQAAVVLNVSPDHLDRHPDLDAYAAAKGRIYAHAQVQVVNRDDALAAALARAEDAQVSFGLDTPPATRDFGLATHGDGTWLVHGRRRLLREDELALAGRHNIANALAALALGTAVGLDMEAMVEALRAFPGLPHRTQRVAETDGVLWINDSKATNVGATVAALEGIAPTRPGRIVLIAGGEGKGADFAPLRGAVARHCRAVLLLGRDAPRLESALAGAAPVQRVRDMRQAVRRAGRLAEPGDAVLLSPACASWDMYPDYTVRGEDFMREVGTWRS